MKPRPVHYFPPQEPGLYVTSAKSLCRNFVIRLETGARWTTDPAAVTCPNCRKHSQFPVEVRA